MSDQPPAGPLGPFPPIDPDDDLGDRDARFGGPEVSPFHDLGVMDAADDLRVVGAARLAARGIGSGSATGALAGLALQRIANALDELARSRGATRVDSVSFNGAVTMRFVTDPPGDDELAIAPAARQAGETFLGLLLARDLEALEELLRQHTPAALRALARLMRLLAEDHAAMDWQSPNERPARLSPERASVYVEVIEREVDHAPELRTVVAEVQRIGVDNQSFRVKLAERMAGHLIVTGSYVEAAEAGLLPLLKQTAEIDLVVQWSTRTGEERPAYTLLEARPHGLLEQPSLTPTAAPR